VWYTDVVRRSPGNPAVIELAPFRPVTLRPRLSVGYAFFRPLHSHRHTPKERVTKWLSGMAGKNLTGQV